MDFLNKLRSKWGKGKFVCVGLDKGDFEFNKTIIDQTADLVCAYKPNIAFYEVEGIEGWTALEKTAQYIHENYPDIFLLLDAKKGDIDNTNKYIKAIFDQMGFDALTIHPYLGREAIQPFLTKQDKGIFVLVKTSNKGAGEFQDLPVDGKPLYQVVAEHVKDWNINGNIGVVVGGTYPAELKKVRKVVGDMPILIPGIGAQGGDVKQAVKAGMNSQGEGIIISSSRNIIFAPSPREATQILHSQIQEALKNV